MKNAMQLKSLIKNISKEKHISAQLVLQNYMMERLLERISVSDYSSNFILKGGFLIASMVGLDTRATMDMDGTIKGLPVSKESIAKMFNDICRINIDDDINFSIRSIGDIREGDEYPGYRVALTANFPPMAVPLKLDITTGDKITPKEIEYHYKMMFKDKYIPVLAYNPETVLAEKLETVISRGDQNTRPRDYYDIYILEKLKFSDINISSLKKALSATADKRGSNNIITNYQTIIDIVKNSDVMNKQWLNYQKDFEYSRDITFNMTCDAVMSIMDKLNDIND